MQQWLLFHKKKWTIQLEQRKLARKRRRLEDQSSNEMAPRAPTSRSLSGFMNQTANNILNTHWQIIQVCAASIMYATKTRPNECYMLQWLLVYVQKLNKFYCTGDSIGLDIFLQLD